MHHVKKHTTPKTKKHQKEKKKVPNRIHYIYPYTSPKICLGFKNHFFFLLFFLFVVQKTFEKTTQKRRERERLDDDVGGVGGGGSIVVVERSGGCACVYCGRKEEDVSFSEHTPRVYR